MARLEPLPPEHTPQLKKAFAQLNAAVMDPAGKVDLGLRRLIGHLASKAAGCLYCQAHTVLGAKNFGVDDARLAQLWDFRTSGLFSGKERVALEFALAAAQQPNAVTDELFAELRRHWSEEEIVEILGVVAMFGFLNRWNDSMATPLEPAAANAGRKFLGERGWAPGKHAR